VTSWILAIDFGTSYTVAAVRVGERAPEIVDLAGERRMPSVVMVDADGQIFVGRTAEDLSVTHPESTLRALKNRLGEQTPAILGGRPHQVVSLVAALLREVYDEVVLQMGEPPQEIRLTHPATWNQPRINRLVEACAKAGLPSPVLIPEPVAAALSFAADVGVQPGRPIVVYDLGGGTFDSAVVVARNGGFAVVGRPGGDQHIGGELFDEMLVNHIGSMIDPAAWDAIQVGGDALWLQVGAALRNEARKAKEALSSHPYVSVLVPLPSGLSQVRITRDELQDMVRPYITETIAILRRCIDEAGVRPEDLAGISLVGGSSRSPVVEQMVAEAFPMVPISRRGDPKATVAAGATLADRPSDSAPGLWKSPVTQEASPGTAQQRVRLAPPPLSDPPQRDVSLSEPSGPASLQTPPAPSSPPPPPPVRPTPAVSPTPSSAPFFPSGMLTPEPVRMTSRKPLMLLLAALLLAAAVVVAVKLVRHHDTSKATDVSGPGASEVATDTEPTDAGTLATPSPETTAPPESDQTIETADTAASSSRAPTVDTAFVPDQPAGTHYETLTGNSGPVTATAFSADGGRVAAAGADGVAVVWNVATGAQIAELVGHDGVINSLAFSPDGRTVATAGDDRTVRLWDAATGEQKRGFTGHTDAVVRVRFSPDGSLLLSASADGTARLWHVRTGSAGGVFTGENGRLNFAEFSPDGLSIIGGGDDGSTLLWHAGEPDNPIRLDGHVGPVRVGAFSPDGTLILSGGDDARILVWSTETDQLVYNLGNIEGGVVSATFSHDGSRLMANGYDNTAALWDVASGDLLGDLAGHGDVVYTAVFSEDDRKVLTASGDGTARIWDVAPGTPIGVEVAVLPNDAPVHSAVFSADGHLAATGNDHGDVLIWSGG
jgi:WD40 repeat protein/actin-like ATPase involved in cell morphogenesis